MTVFAVLGVWIVCLELQVVAVPGLQLGPVFGDYAHNVIEVMAGLLCLGGAWQARRHTVGRGFENLDHLAARGYEISGPAWK